jgi:hypothetical protein
MAFSFLVRDSPGRPSLPPGADTHSCVASHAEYGALVGVAHQLEMDGERRVHR